MYYHGLYCYGGLGQWNDLFITTYWYMENTTTIHPVMVLTAVQTSFISRYMESTLLAIFSLLSPFFHKKLKRGYCENFNKTASDRFPLSEKKYACFSS